jgi:hypothetical protein
MRLTVILALLAFAATTSPAQARPVAHAAATCSDYPNQAAAQRAADTRDADGDGVYCESLPCPCSTAAGGGGTTPPSPPAPKPVTCGRERWSVKTTTDRRASLIDLDPVASSVDQLRRMDVPAVSNHTPRISGIETTVYRVRARLVSFKIEDDGDIHLVIASRSNRSHTMIVEFPDSGCLGGVGPSKKRKMVAARNAVVRACGTPSETSFRRLRGSATIDGVGFVDRKHGQRGVAPNGIELHPVLRFRLLTACR